MLFRSTHDLGLPRTLLTMLALNVARYENGSEEKLLSACQGVNLAEIFIVSNCAWGAPEEGAETASGVNFPALTIGVTEAKGVKCPRCWMHSENANAEGLCPRCAAVVAGLDVEL